MKTNIKMVTTALMMALMCAAAAGARPNNVKAEGKLAVRDVLTADISKDVTGRYVKRQASEEEVQNKVSAVKAQISDPVDGVRHIRFVAAIDSYLYDTAKFNIVAKNGEEVVKTFADKEVTTAYTHIEANGKVLSAAEAFNNESYNYMVAYTINNVPEEAWGYNFEVSVSIKTAEAEDFTTSEVANKVINKVEFDDKIGAGAVEIVNDATYPWTMEMVDGVATLASTNQGMANTKAVIKFKALKDTIVSFDWFASGEARYDYLIVEVSSLVLVQNQSSVEGVNGSVSHKLNAGETISFTFRKDSGGNKGEDRAVITNLHFTDGIPAVEITKVFNDGVTPNGNASGELLSMFGTEALAAPVNVRGDAYEFDAWYYDAEFTQKVNVEDIHSLEKITIYANWKEKAVVEFVVPEGATPVETMNVWTYDAIDVADPVKAKSIFRGWFADAEYNTPVDLAKGVKESCTLYAKFDELPEGASKDYTHVIELGEGVNTWDVKARTSEEFQTYYFEFTPEITDEYIFVCENYTVSGGTASYNSYAKMWIEKADGTLVVSDFMGKAEVQLEAGTTYYAMFNGAKYYLGSQTSWGSFDLGVYRFEHDSEDTAFTLELGAENEIPVGTFNNNYEKLVYKYEATATTGIRFYQESNEWLRTEIFVANADGKMSNSYMAYAVTGTSSTTTKTMNINVEAGKTYYFVVSNNWNESKLAVGEGMFAIYEYGVGYTPTNPSAYELGTTITADFTGGPAQYYAFNIGAEDIYKISTTGGTSDINKNIEIYAADNLNSALVKVSGVGDIDQFANLPVGEYIIKISYEKEATGAFTVSVNAAANGETILKPIAAELPGQGEVVAEITAGGYYSFTTGDEKVFHFFSTDDKTVVLTIYDNLGNVVATSTNGTVYAKLDANQSYVLHVDAAAVVNYETATSIQDGKSIDTAFVYSDVTQINNDLANVGGNVVWFTFTAEEAGNYAFYSLNNGTIDTKGSLCNADGSTIKKIDDGGAALMEGMGGYKWDFYIGTEKGYTVTLEAGQTIYLKVEFSLYDRDTSDKGVVLNLYIVKEA